MRTRCDAVPLLHIQDRADAQLTFRSCARKHVLCKCGTSDQCKHAANADSCRACLMESAMKMLSLPFVPWRITCCTSALASSECLCQGLAQPTPPCAGCPADPGNSGAAMLLSSAHMHARMQSPLIPCLLPMWHCRSRVHAKHCQAETERLAFGALRRSAPFQVGRVHLLHRCFA